MICHMAASLDGRIDCAMTEVIGGDEYYETLEQLGAKTEINGTVEMRYKVLKMTFLMSRNHIRQTQ